MNNTESYDPMVGEREIAVGSIVIPAELLGDITVNYEEGEISTDSQAGTTVTPSGKAATSEFSFNFKLPRQNAQQYLSYIWPEIYSAPTAEAQKSGAINFGDLNCTTRTPVAVNIHNKCDATDDNDIFIPAALFKISFNPTFSTSEAAAFDVTGYAQPNSAGPRIRFGTGDLTQPSKYDPTTKKTVPVTSGD